MAAARKHSHDDFKRLYSFAIDIPLSADALAYRSRTAGYPLVKIPCQGNRTLRSVRLRVGPGHQLTAARRRERKAGNNSTVQPV